MKGGQQLLKSWLLMLAVLAVCLPPMLIGLGNRDSTHTMENIAMLSAQETWLRQHGYVHIEAEPTAWLMPTRNGQPRVTKPPMLVWLHMLAWADLDPYRADPQLLLYRARLVAVALGVLVIGSVFWAGLTLGDRQQAVIAALTCGTMWFVQRQARTASYDIHMTAWVTLAVASTLWAMQPFRPPPSLARFTVGWTISGLALAAAWLSKGPLALVVTLAPLASWLFLIRQRRWAGSVGLLAMVAIATVAVLPWYAHAARVSGALQVWSSEFRAQRPEFQEPWYYLGLLALIAPWSLWLVSALFQPFLRADGRRRRLLLIPWLWFVVIFLFFSIPGAKQQRYILPLVPAAALLVGQLWRFHQELADRRQVDRGVNLLRVLHWAALLATSLLWAPFLLGQDWMVAWGWFEHRPVGPFKWPMAVGGSVLLTAIAGFGARWHFKWEPLKAAGATTAWTLVCTTMLWHGYSHSATGVHPIRFEAERISRMIGDHRLYQLRIASLDDPINEEFLFYCKRIVPSMGRSELHRTLQTIEGKVFVIAQTTEKHDRILARFGCQRVADFDQDHDLPNRLWEYHGSKPAHDLVP